MSTHDNAPKPDWWDCDPHTWPSMSLPSEDFDVLMAALDRPGRVNEALLDALHEHRLRVLPESIILGEN